MGGLERTSEGIKGEDLEEDEGFDHLVDVHLHTPSQLDEQALELWPRLASKIDEKLTREQ